MGDKGPRLTMRPTLAGRYLVFQPGQARADVSKRITDEAERERLLYEVTGKIRQSTNVQTILSTTAQEITKAIGAQHAEVKITIDNTPEIKEMKHE